MPMARKIHFETVPLSVARKIALQEHLLSHPHAQRCEICEQFVELETCKIDELGRAVHNDCYVGKLAGGSNGPMPSSLS